MMNIILCVIVGGMAGWIGYSFMKLNEMRSLPISLALGMFGGYIGGQVVAPAIGLGAVNSGDFSPFPLVVALASAAAILIISSMIHKRFGF